MYLYIREPRPIKATPPNPRSGVKATSAPRPIRPARPAHTPENNYVVTLDI